MRINILTFFRVSELLENIDTLNFTERRVFFQISTPGNKGVNRFVLSRHVLGTF